MTIDEYVKSLDTEFGSSDSEEFDEVLKAIKKSECLANLSANAASFMVTGEYNEFVVWLQDTLALAFMAGHKGCE